MYKSYDQHLEKILNLKQCIQTKEEELSTLRKQLADLEGNSSDLADKQSPILDQHSISRFSRQLILPEFGPQGQLKLQASSVLIVGCGGLGCPTAQYLAASGIGKLGLVDYDTVDLSNLHRQVLHTEKMINQPKTSSIEQYCKNINSRILCQSYNIALDSSNAMNIIKEYDVIADCTDNVATRYLLNDACVLLNKPLVSGAALRFEGQLTVYNYDGGPCYRCLFPEPPSPKTVTNCSDGGVIGVVPGVIGVLQALEIMKILASFGKVCSSRMIMFDGLDGSFRSFKLRSRQTKCAICGDSPSIKELIDYEQFCGSKANDKEKELHLLTPQERMSVHDYKLMRDKNVPHILIDVRMPVELEICSISNVLNVPIQYLLTGKRHESLQSEIERTSIQELVCICRRGNDSQKAVQYLKSKLPDTVIIRDIVGGLLSWSKNIDSNFPVY